MFAVLLVLSTLPAVAQDESATVGVLTPEDQAQILRELLPNGWRVGMGPTQFTPGNLYEQIDRRAPTFQGYEVVGLTFVRFDDPSDEGRFVDVALFDMGTPTRAFGAFSSQRAAEAIHLDLGREAYEADGQLGCWVGQFYAEIFVSDTSAATATRAFEMAPRLVARLPEGGEPIWGLEALPADNRVLGSERYFEVDELGLGFADRTFVATYRLGEEEILGYLSRRDSEEEARQTRSVFLAYAMELGNGYELVETEGGELAVTNVGGSFDVMLVRGRLVMGVLGVEDEEAAIPAAITFSQGVKTQE